MIAVDKRFFVTAKDGAAEAVLVSPVAPGTSKITASRGGQLLTSVTFEIVKPLVLGSVSPGTSP